MTFEVRILLLTIIFYSIQSLDQLNSSDKITYIYCKYCHVLFESSRFDDHKVN